MSEPMICSRCGARGKTRTVTRGSLLIEIVLWLCFLVPGLIYTLWRHSSRSEVCAQCGASELVPATTPRGRELMTVYHPGVQVTDGIPAGNAVRGYVWMAIIAIAVVLLIAKLI